MTKEDILTEIRRTAQENGGKPLGMGRFERATGIKPYDIAKHWARFGDAQREAGFEPNTLQVGYVDDYLFDKIASLTRELKKYPTKMERGVKSHSDPSFPSPNTFDRLGNKSQLITKVLAYCSTRPEYADVIKIITDTESITEESSTYLEAEGKEVKYGFVYLVRGHPGEYKIGRTNLVDRRLSELGATASIDQELVHEIKTDDPAGIEAYWHRRFQDKRMKGEWFRLSPTDVKTFKRWKRIY